MDQTVFSRRVSGDRCEFDISFGQTTIDAIVLVSGLWTRKLQGDGDNGNTVDTTVIPW